MDHKILILDVMRTRSFEQRSCYREASTGVSMLKLLFLKCHVLVHRGTVFHSLSIFYCLWDKINKRAFVCHTTVLQCKLSKHFSILTESGSLFHSSRSLGFILSYFSYFRQSISNFEKRLL